MPEQSISVEFKSICEDISTLCEISIEHDDELNGGTSTFQVGNQIFYKVYPAGVCLFYTSLGGTVSTICSAKKEQKTEELVFDGTDQANLSYPLEGKLSYKWIGGVLGAKAPHLKANPAIIATSGSATLMAKEPVYGVLEVTYEYTYASIKFIPALSGKQILLVCRDCKTEEVCISVVEEIEDQAFDDVTLTINDACESDLKVAGAQVEVNGELVDSVTDENGQIHVGLLAKGTHTIKVTAPGYTPSDEDNLSNDTIVVE